MASTVDNLRSRLRGPLLALLRPPYRLFRRSFVGRWLLRRSLYRDLKSAYLYDAHRYFTYGVMGRYNERQASLEARIIKESHCLEKGLAHHSPRLRFGQQHIDNIIADLTEYIPKFGRDLAVDMGTDVLAAYIEHHQRQGVALDGLQSALQTLLREEQVGACAERCGGSLPAARVEIHAAGKMDIEGFLRSRHSIRQFEARPVEKELMEKAVSLAITTPSVCNRQMWKARVFSDRDRVQAVLGLQNGNRGFGDQVNTVIVVTCDLQCFAAAGERNEAWIDGGMFAMTLTLALHSLGLGTCCLNWSVTEGDDRKLRGLVGLPEAEVIIMLIAVGHIPDRLSVTRSTRKPLEDILHWDS